MNSFLVPTYAFEAGVGPLAHLVDYADEFGNVVVRGFQPPDLLFPFYDVVDVAGVRVEGDALAVHPVLHIERLGVARQGDIVYSVLVRSGQKALPVGGEAEA